MMGLIYGQSVARPVQYFDSALRRTYQLGELRTPTETSSADPAGTWTNTTRSGTADPNTSEVTHGEQDLTIKDIAVEVVSSVNWNAVLDLNGSEIETYTGSGSMAETLVSVSFEGKRITPRDTFTFTVTRTSGVGNVQAKIRLSGFQL